MAPTRNVIRLALAIAVALLLASITVSLAPAARADLTIVQCAGSDTQTYNPGLRNFTQTVTLTATPEGSPCAGLGMISGDDSFSGVFTATVPLSCDEVPFEGVTASQVFTWSPSGRTSTWAATSVEVTYLDGSDVLTYTGTITAGDYAGTTLTDVEAIPTAELTACDSPPGLTQATGIPTWTFTGA